MASNEIMSDAELDNVVGGSGIECVAFLSRLEAEGIYKPTTKLIRGNEKAAAKELEAYLSTLTRQKGSLTIEVGFIINSNGEKNCYTLTKSNPQGSVVQSLSADELFEIIRDW